MTTREWFDPEFAEPDVSPPPLPEQSPTWCWTHCVDEADQIIEEGESNV